MRSLIILEVEHGEDTDSLNIFTDAVDRRDSRLPVFFEITDYTVRVDLPECFRLDD